MTHRLTGTVALLAACALVSQVSVAAVVNDFETDGNGVAFTGLTDIFAFDEYAGDGILILDSDPSVALTEVDQLNPANDGAFIQGYYVNVGAFVSEGPTSLTILFEPASVTTVGFSFASPSGAINVRAYGEGGGLLFDQNFNATDPFTLASGFPALEGSASIGGVGNIALIDIRPNPNEILSLDNLRYTVVPLPAALPLMAGALLVMGRGLRRRVG